MRALISSVAGLLLLGLCACSSDDSGAESNAAGSPQPFGSPSNSGMTARGGSAGASAALVTIAGFGRPSGMAIGTAAEDATEGGDEDPDPSAPAEETPAPDDIAIPTFETPMLAQVPCTGCVELSAIVDDINQRSQFTFNAGGVQASRVVWTILLPFNSDQLFIRSIVNGGDGPYTFMSANVFGALNTPVEFAQEFSGVVNTLGIALGSAGAWTGDQRVSVFVDSVRLEGANDTRTFDADAGGFTAQGSERQPLVQFH